MRIAFDLGGVITKFPAQFMGMAGAFGAMGHILYVISDITSVKHILSMLEDNKVDIFDKDKILSADYATHGEACKAVLCREYYIDILIDDFPGYLVWPWPEPAPLRLQVMPDPYRPYNDPGWVTSADVGSFGRRVFNDGGTPSKFVNPDYLGRLEALSNVVVGEPCPKCNGIKWSQGSFYKSCVMCGYHIEISFGHMDWLPPATG